MQVKDVVFYLETIVPLSFQEEYDNSGLICGDPDSDLSGILISVDVNEKVVQEAVKRNANFIITHHPLIFKAVKQILQSRQNGRVIREIIKNDLSIYALHTNLDNFSEGLNALVCKKIGLQNCRVLLPERGGLYKLVTFCPTDYTEKVRNALFEAGAGNIGNYDSCSYNLHGQGTFRAAENANPFVGEKNALHFEDETRIEVIFPRHLEKKLVNTLLINHPYEEVAYDIYPLQNLYFLKGTGMIGELPTETEPFQFLRKVKEVTGIQVIRHSAIRQKTIRKVALCTGSGSFLIPDALSEGADIFLTADLKYHEFFDTSGSLILADIGHYESEQFAMEWIYNKLFEKFSKFAVLISETNTNPVNYF